MTQTPKPIDTNRLRNRLLYWIACAAVAILPAVITLLTVRFHLDAQLEDGIPVYYGIYNDSFYYWRQIGTFNEAGFNGGYYTIYEDPAAAEFSHFYVHGPLFPMIYGSIAHITGWQTYSGPFINMLLVTLALSLFIYTLRPTYSQLALLGITVATFWPMLLYLSVLMQESLHFSFGIVLAALFYRLLKREKPLPLWLLISYVLLIIGFSLVRVLWAFMFIPLFLLNNHKKSVFHILIALLLGAGLMGGMFLIANMIMAPYSLSYLQDLLSAFKISPTAGLTILWDHIRLNVDNFQNGDLLAVLQRYQIVILILIAGVSALLLYFTSRKPDTEGQHSNPVVRWSWKEIALHFLTLGIPLVFTTMLYDFFDWHDYRVLGPPLLTSVLVLVAYNRRAAISLLVLSNLVLLPTFFTTYHDLWSAPYTFDQQRIADFGTLTQELLVFDPEAENAWCNTVYLQVTDRENRFAVFPAELLAIDRRLGISFFIDPNQVELPIKSKYFLMDSWTIDALPSTTHTEILGYTPVGNLYLNLDADC